MSIIPVRYLCLNRLYFEISKRNEKKCLTINCRNVNSIGPGKYRTNAENPETQFCYFTEKKKNKSFDTFVSKRLIASQFEISF